MRLTTPDGASVVLQHLASGTATGDGRQVVLAAHATGFHGRCWLPVAAHLQAQTWAPDFRGFGDSTAPATWQEEWSGYGEDALAAARAVADLTGGPMLGVGHSMGGAALVMAALEAPELFTGLVLYEPVIFPSRPIGEGPNLLADGARRRREAFESFDAARANFASKPPMNAFTPEALDAYVMYGLRLGDDGLVHLKCTPEHEARTYEMSALQHTFQGLSELTVPVLFLHGRADPRQPPSEITPELARRTPGSQVLQLPHLDHFAPLTHPEEFAGHVNRFADGLARTE